MGTAKADNKAIDNDIHLETDNGNLIKIDIDNEKWRNWLENNDSFKFIAGFGGEDSYRARKEVLGGVVYWYAFKKVNGKLHKRYIGKPHEVTHNRLCEVAKTIRDVKVKAIKEDKPVNNSNQIGNAKLEELVNQLVNQVNELTKRIDNLENKGDDTTVKKSGYPHNEELEARIRELETVNQELTIQLQETKIELKAARNDATLLNQEIQRLTSELDSKNNKLTELTNELANKDRELQELKETVSIPKTDIDYIQRQLKKASIDKTAKDIREVFKKAGFDGTNSKDLRDEVIKILST